MHAVATNFANGDCAVCPIFLFSILVYVHARHRVSFQLRDQGIVSRESWATSLARWKLCALLIDPSTGWPRSRRAAPFLNVPALLFVEVGYIVYMIFLHNYQRVYLTFLNTQKCI